MIFVNGAGNPDGIMFGLTALENVYFNGTLVWSLNAQSSDEYGTFEIPEGNAADFGIDTGGSGSGSGGGSGGTNPYEISGTATLSRRSGHADYFNDVSFASYILIVTPVAGQGDTYETGVKYSCTITSQMSWSLYKQIGAGLIDDYLYVYADDGAMTGFSNIPSGMTLESAHSTGTAHITLLVDLVGNPVFDPSTMTTRVYPCEVFCYKGSKYVRFMPYGDEYNIITATAGLTYQGAGELLLKFT